MRCRTTAAAGVLFTAALSLGVSGTAHAADYDCPDFVSQADAQAVYNADPSDPHGLDGPIGAGYSGVLGVACEEHDYVANPGTITSAMALGTTTGGGQVATRPAGAVAAGDGSSSDEASALPYVLGGVALTAAGGSAFAARRSSRPTV